MPGVAIDVLQTPAAPGGARSLLTTVTTTKAGGYEYRYRGLASGVVELAYAKLRGAGVYETTRAVKVTVVPKIAFSPPRPTAKHGRKVRFSGAVTFVPQPPKGALVGIQVRRAGRWQPIDVVRLTKDGRFAWPHTFATRGRYEFRARTYASAGIPGAESKPATLRVR